MQSDKKWVQILKNQLMVGVNLEDKSSKTSLVCLVFLLLKNSLELFLSLRYICTKQSDRETSSNSYYLS